MGRAIKVLVECGDSEEGYLEGLLHGEAARSMEGTRKGFNKLVGFKIMKK